MLFECRCYRHDEEFKELSSESIQNWNKNGRKSEDIEYNAMLNTDNIVSLIDGQYLYDPKLKINLHPIVIATMTSGKKFFIKANSISELRLKSVINGNGDLV